MGFGQSISTCFRKSFTWSGTATRSEHNYFILFIFLINFFASFCIQFVLKLNGASEDTQHTAMLYQMLASAVIFFFPMIAVHIRRCGDAGLSKWWCLLLLIVILNYIFIAILIFKGTSKQNLKDSSNSTNSESELLSDEQIDQNGVLTFSKHLQDSDRSKEDKLKLTAEDSIGSSTSIEKVSQSDDYESESEIQDRKDLYKKAVRSLRLSVFFGFLSTIIVVFVQKVLIKAESVDSSTGNFIGTVAICVVVLILLIALFRATASLCRIHQISVAWSMLLLVPVVNLVFIGIIALPEEAFDNLLR